MREEPFEPTGPADASPWGSRSGLVLAAVALAATLPFAGTLGHAPVWDDAYIADQVEEAYRANGLRGVLAAPFLAQAGAEDQYYRPWVSLSFWADARLGGGSPLPYRLTSVFLHGANALLAALLLRRLAPSAFGALAGALLFAVHPVQVEAVAFASARTDLWAAFFVLLSTLAWTGGTPQEGAARRAARLAAGAAAYGLAVLSKESAAALPAWLVALSLLTGAGRRARRALLPSVAAHAAVLAAVLAVRAWALGRSGPIPEDAGGGPLLLSDPSLAARALLRLLRMPLAPWPHNALLTREHLAPGAVSALASAGLAALFAAASWGRRARLGALGAAWFLLFLAPALLIDSRSTILAAERYLYLPLLGAALALASVLGAIAPPDRRPPKAAFATLAVLVLALGASDAARARVWRDDLTLARDVVRTSPLSALAHDRLGQALLERERYADALGSFRRAVEIDPRDAAWRNDLGIALRRLGRPDLAADAFRAAIALDPGMAGARLNLAYACLSLRDAGCVGEQARILRSTDPDAYAQLEGVLAGH